MKKNLYIKLMLAGISAATLLTGCGGSATHYYSDGINCYNDKEYIEAVACFEKAVEKEPANVDYAIHFGMAQIEIAAYETAIDTFKQLLEDNDDNRDIHRGLGIAYYQSEKIAMAEEQFKTVIEDSDSKYDDIHLDALKYYAACLYRTENYQDALDIYNKLIDNTEKKNRAELYYLRGCTYIRLDDENNAVLDYESSLSIKDDYSMYCNMYTNFSNAGYTDRAESYLKRVIDLEDSDDLLIGKTYYILGDYDTATGYLQSAVDAGKSEAIYYLAMNYEAKQDYSKAEDLYHDYLAKNANDPVIYNQYGAYLISRGKYDNALVYIETGLELKKKEAKQELLYNQAVCYEYLHDYDKAYELFKDYISNYSGDKAAIKELEFLKTR